ncbi:LPS translocon maturation chaperone LptM [Natronospirillum operosum]|nr:lipoprotein [Natronospirillum operosum]
MRCRLTALLWVTLMLAACGYKTDLTLPEEEARATPVIPVTEARMKS